MSAFADEEEVHSFIKSLTERNDIKITARRLPCRTTL